VRLAVAETRFALAEWRDGRAFAGETLGVKRFEVKIPGRRRAGLRKSAAFHSGPFRVSNPGSPHTASGRTPHS
jgi:hypothetical protein